MSGASPENERSVELRAVEQQIFDHPGRKEQDPCDGLARTVYAVLIPNRDELIGLLDVTERRCYSTNRLGALWPKRRACVFFAIGDQKGRSVNGGHLKVRPKSTV